jgi:hypothetical protein
LRMVSSYCGLSELHQLALAFIEDYDGWMFLICIVVYSLEIHSIAVYSIVGLFLGYCNSFLLWFKFIHWIVRTFWGISNFFE